MYETKRPVRAKVFILNTFALTGRIDGDVWITQGVALGYALVGLSARVIEVLTHPHANSITI